MDAFLFWSVIAFFALQLIAAFFSLAETALLSLTRSQIAEIKENAEENMSALRLTKLLGDPRRFLIFILAGNTIVNVLAATTAALATSRILAGHEELKWLVYVIQGVVVALILLVMGEIVPKFAAVRNPYKWSLRIATPLTFFSYLLWPVTAVMMPLADGIARLFGVEKKKLWISEEEIKTLLEVGEEHGALEKTERDMIHSIFELGEITVREIMVPRTDMVAIEVSTPLSKILTSCVSAVIRGCRSTKRRSIT
ncbi:MAG: DUF21 domain-containing protein [bacterium]|nr:DUF21 domain-containing protein [bacterium]